MHLVALFTATALGLGSLATAYIYHDKSDLPPRYGSWQELSAAQPSCRSMGENAMSFPHLYNEQR
jgi:hypothetical protein